MAIIYAFLVFLALYCLYHIIRQAWPFILLGVAIWAWIHFFF